MPIAAILPAIAAALTTVGSAAATGVGAGLGALGTGASAVGLGGLGSTLGAAGSALGGLGAAAPAAALPAGLTAGTAMGGAALPGLGGGAIGASALPEIASIPGSVGGAGPLAGIGGGAIPGITGATSAPTANLMGTLTDLSRINSMLPRNQSPAGQPLGQHPYGGQPLRQGSGGFNFAGGPMAQPVQSYLPGAGNKADTMRTLLRMYQLMGSGGSS